MFFLLLHISIVNLRLLSSLKFIIMNAAALHGALFESTQNITCGDYFDAFVEMLKCGGEKWWILFVLDYRESAGVVLFCDADKSQTVSAERSCINVILDPSYVVTCRLDSR